MFDRDFESAMKNWLGELEAWLAGGFEECRKKHPEYGYNPDEPYRAFTSWHGTAPDPDYHRPLWKDGEATWFQVYETVSEGTPVTPPFATREELVDYLCTHGDFWDQKRRLEGSSMSCGPWERDAAESFVKAGFAPSMVVMSGASGTVIKTPRDGIV